MFYICGLFIFSWFFSASYLPTAFSFLALFALGYSHTPSHLFWCSLLSCVHLFLLSSIYGFQFQVSGVFSLLLLLSLAFFSWMIQVDQLDRVIIDADINLDDVLL